MFFNSWDSSSARFSVITRGCCRIWVPHEACLSDSHPSPAWIGHHLKCSSLTVCIMLGLSIFRSHFQIMCWKELLAASAHWSWLCLLKPVWQPSCSFRWQNTFSLVHFGTCGTDTPTLLTSFEDVLWDYSTVWLKIKQVNPNGQHLLIFFFSFSEREKHDGLLNTPETPASHYLTVNTEVGAVLSLLSKCWVLRSLQCQKAYCLPLFFCTFVCLCVYLGMCRVKAPFVAVGSVLLPYTFWKMS